jgi:ribosomal subunit interface protein
MDLSESIQDYVEKRISALSKYFPEDVLASVEVGRTTKHHKSGDIFRAEVFIRGSGKEYYAVSEKEDLYAAIDDVKDEIRREVTSWKNKTRTIIRRGGARVKNLIKRLTWRK